jgi:hypothetical protein
VGTPEGKRPLGRTGYGLQNTEIGTKIWSGYVEWIYLAQGADQW